jgi:hypothetical protein
MMKKKKTAFGAAGLAIVVAIGAAAILGSGSAEAESPRGNFSLAHAQTFTDFPLYYAGETVAGLPLNYVLRQPINQRKSSVSFIYGDCIPRGDAGCAPPVEVQIWPACVRNPSLYKAQGPVGPVAEMRTVRGVPAAFFEDGHRVEIQTGTATVVIFGREQSLVTEVANELRGVNVPVQATNKLPASDSRALVGKLPCS